MADGDAASAIGLAIMTGLEKVKDVWKQVNATRDMIANHITSGAHSAAQITSGVLNAARIPALSTLTGIAPAATKLDNGSGMTLQPSGGQFTASGHLGVLGAFAANGTITLANPYGNILTTSYRSLYIRSDGVVGHVPSSRRYKKNIHPADIDPAAVLSLVPVEFDYYKKYGGGHDTGLIAEDVQKAGLDFLTLDGDQDGVVDGIAYERLAVALLAVVRAQQADIRALTARLDRLEA